MYLNHQRRGADQAELEKLLCALGLIEGRMRGAIREDQPVHAELAIVRRIAKITAVGPEGVAVFIPLRQRLVDPVPDKAALQAGVITKRLPVFGKAAEAVAHRMGVLAEDQRARLIRQGNPLLNRPLRHGRKRLVHIDAGIHRADDIGGGRVRPAALILYRTRRIAGLHPAVERVMACAVAGLVPQRPDNDGGMVAVALHHAGDTLAHGREPVRIVRQSTHRHHAVGFNIGFIDDVEAVAIAQPVPERMVRIVRAAHGVKVMLLHQLDIPTHGGLVHRLAGFRVMLMTVNPADQQRLTVDLQLTVANLHLAHAHVARFDLQQTALGIQQRDGQPIEMRRFSAPEIGLIDSELDA